MTDDTVCNNEECSCRRRNSLAQAACLPPCTEVASSSLCPAPSTSSAIIHSLHPDSNDDISSPVPIESHTEIHQEKNESLLFHIIQSSRSLHLSNTLLCGALAGIAAKTVIAPVERIKMTFQVSADRFTLQAALQRGIATVKNEGIFSLWKGHSTTVLRVAPYAAFSYTFHDLAELFFRQMSLSSQERQDHKPLAPIYKFAAGSIGGLTGTLLTYPLDVLRVRIALGGNWQSSLQQGGLYHGLLPTLLGIAPYAGTAWLVKQTLLEFYLQIYPKSKFPQGPSILESLGINAIAGLMGQFVTYPLDILRRRMQIARPMEVVHLIEIKGKDHVSDMETHKYAPNRGSNVNANVKRYLSMTELLKQLWREEGLRGLGKGFSLNIIKGPISLSVSLTAYDWLRMHVFKDENASNHHNNHQNHSHVQETKKQTNVDANHIDSRGTMVGGATFLSASAEELSKKKQSYP